jgi:predicted metalloprotease with PDZ domain
MRLLHMKRQGLSMSFDYLCTMIFRLFLIFSFLILKLFASGDTLYYTINLNHASEGKIQVKGILPPHVSGQTTWQMPAIVPGTYKIYDFGRFISDWKAVSLDGRSLTVQKDAPNTWMVSSTERISVEYTVSQTKGFGEEEDNASFEREGRSVFYPAGTIFKPREVFLLNTFAAMGYANGQPNAPIRLTLILSDSLYAATARDIFCQSGDTVEFIYESYYAFADQPLLISRPETAVLRFDESQVMVAVYDPEKKAPAGKIAEQLKKILDAQQQYLTGKLPVARYAFLVYIDPDFNLFGSFGALEHNYSSVYYLPSMEEEWLYSQIKDIGAHEFFHILTPLNLHSEQIHFFNFEKPEMSRHLWLYEGVTEYASHLVQVQYDIKTEKEFLETIREKILEAREFNSDISMVEMSLGCLDTFESEYQSVYSKGALVAMGLDLVLRRYMPDQSGLPELMHRLSLQYGKDKPFADTALFTIIEEASVPQAGTYLREYVGKARSLPLTELLDYAGYTYFREKTVKGFTLGGIELSVNPETGRLVAIETGYMDAFGKKIGYKTGDEFYRLNGQDLTMENLEKVFTTFFDQIKEGDMVQLDLMRYKRNGKSKVVKREARMIFVDYTQEDVIERNPDAGDLQQAVRKAWLKRLD